MMISVLSASFIQLGHAKNLDFFNLRGALVGLKGKPASRQARVRLYTAVEHRNHHNSAFLAPQPHL